MIELELEDDESEPWIMVERLSHSSSSSELYPQASSELAEAAASRSTSRLEVRKKHVRSLLDLGCLGSYGLAVGGQAARGRLLARRLPDGVLDEDGGAPR